MAKHGFDQALQRNVRGVRICSIIVLIIGILATIMSIFIVVSGPIVSAAASNPDISMQFSEDFGFSPSDAAVGIGVAGIFLTVMGIVSLVASVLDIVIGGLGLYGAKHPEHIGPFWVLSIITLICSCVSIATSIVMTALSGGDTGGDLVTTLCSNGASLALNICCVVFASRVRSIVKSGFTA